MPIYSMHIAQRFVCAFFTLPHNMRDTSMNSVLSVLYTDTHQPAVEPFEPLGWFFSMGNAVTTAFCFVQTLRMFLPLFMPPLFSMGSMLSVGMFLWRLWMANTGCCYCGLRWHVRFPVFNEVDMILSLKGFFSLSGFLSPGSEVFWSRGGARAAVTHPS